MTIIQLTILIVLVWLCVYSIINRICMCVEHCSTGKAFAAAVKKQQEEGNNGGNEENVQM